MQASAATISEERASRVARITAEEAEAAAREAEARQKVADGKLGKGTGGSGPEFLLNEYKKLGDQSLGDAIKGRGRATLVRDRDD